MSPKSIALAVCGGLVFVAILALFVEVGDAPAAANPAKIDEARAKYKATASRPSTSNLSDPWARNPTRDSAPVIGNDTIRPPAIDSPAISEEPPRITPEAAATPDLANDPRLETTNAKDEANRLYDKMDYEGALQKAMAVLDKEPGDVRMLRVATSSACQLGDADKAKQYWAQLPPHDQNQMTRRCQRFGITFPEQ
jgi:hypothetical protein